MPLHAFPVLELPIEILDARMQGYKFGDISRKVAVDVKHGAEEVKKGFESVVQRITKNEVSVNLRTHMLLLMAAQCAG